jgi:hypothetical protein
MAITFVGNTTARVAQGTGAVTVGLPTTQTGDIVIAVLAADLTIINDGIIGQGWTDLVKIDSAGPGNQLAYKVMGATPDTTVDVTQETNRIIACAFQAWRGVDETTPIDIGPASVFGGASAFPDSPSLTTVTDDALFVSTFQLDDRDTTVVTPPTGYTNLLEENTGLGSISFGATVGIASKIVATAGAEDPGSYELGAADTWLAASFALRPAAGGPVDALLGDDAESASEVTAAALGQVHLLSGADAESASEVSAAALGQVHLLAGDDTESGSEVTAPALGQVHLLLGDDVESGSEVTPVALTESTTDALLGDDVESGSEVSAAALGQVHLLAGDDVESGSEVTAPALGQVHLLLGDDVESASEVSAAALTESTTDALLGDDVETGSEVSAAALGQIHLLAGDDVESGSEVAAPALGQVHLLLGGDLESASEVSLATLTELGPVTFFSNPNHTVTARRGGAVIARR